MNYPALITKELDGTGISGSVHFLHGTLSRVFAVNQLIFVLKGELNITYRSSSHQLTAEDFLFICEAEPLSISGEDAHVLFISIPSTSLREHQHEIQCNSTLSPDKSCFSRLKEYLFEIIQTQYSGGTFYELRLQALWKSFLFELLSSFYLASSGSSDHRNYQALSTKRKREQEFTEILDIIEKNYMNPLKLHDLANMYYYAPSYLSRLFLKYTGLHFSEYLTDIRLKKAMTLLTHTNLEIGAIADKTGFPNPRAFQQAFQKKYHMRPSKYRMDFANIHDFHPDEHIRTNIHDLMQQGIITLPTGDSHVSSNDTLPVTHHHLGCFSASVSQPFDVSAKNSVLNIYRAKDLLLDSVQDEIRTLQKEIGFTYINCHGFLADDMQIYFEDIFHHQAESGQRILHYDFSLYEKIFCFAQELGLKFIIQLGYTPLFLAPASFRDTSQNGNNICMPASMNEWNDYIQQFFSFLKNRFGNWLNDCPVLLWQTPDLHIQFFHAVSKEEYFSLYLNTYKTIKQILPDITFASPTISISQSGVNFLQDYLRFCHQHDCVPDKIYTTYIVQNSKNFPLLIPSLECRTFVTEVTSILHSLKIKKSISFHLLEYYHSFGLDDLCDSMAGAMLPIKIILENESLFQSFGYWAASDFTTETVYGMEQFAGGRGIFTRSGGKKAIFYALQFLSRLGNELIASGNGYVLTKKGNSYQLLLYHNIPESEWTETFTAENALHFYQMYLDMAIELSISDLHTSKVLIREEFLNADCGSAYEDWLRSGGTLIDITSNFSHTFSSAPRLQVREVTVWDELLHYHCTLKPFELRFVELFPQP